MQQRRAHLVLIEHNCCFFMWSFLPSSGPFSFYVDLTKQTFPSSVSIPSGDNRFAFRFRQGKVTIGKSFQWAPLPTKAHMRLTKPFRHWHRGFLLGSDTASSDPRWWRFSSKVATFHPGQREGSSRVFMTNHKEKFHAISTSRLITVERTVLIWCPRQNEYKSTCALVVSHSK